MISKKSDRKTGDSAGIVGGISNPMALYEILYVCGVFTIDLRCVIFFFFWGGGVERGGGGERIRKSDHMSSYRFFMTIKNKTPLLVFFSLLKQIIFKVNAIKSSLN